MDTNVIKEKITSAMSAVFEVPAEQINEETSTDSLENWDSLRHLNLVLALEEEFGVSIPDEEVGNMVNFKIIQHVISENI